MCAATAKPGRKGSEEYFVWYCRVPTVVTVTEGTEEYFAVLWDAEGTNGY